MSTAKGHIFIDDIKLVHSNEYIFCLVVCTRIMIVTTAFAVEDHVQDVLDLWLIRLKIIKLNVDVSVPIQD